MRSTILAALSVLCLAAVIDSAELKFYPDDPLLEDDDRLDTPAKPAEIALSDLYDRFGHIFADLGSPERGEAENVNTLDEVPNSSWFTNRHGVQRMSIEMLQRGPDASDGPDPSLPWTIVSSKSGGLTPGFEILDGEGQLYVIKLDPVGVPELSSAAEVIGTKLFYAFGYNVPENFIVYYDPDTFNVEPGTTLEDEFGDEKTLTRGRLRRILRRIPRLPDGRIRMTASKYLPGEPLGPFRYYGTRSDDPNDVILHEKRRELRGLRLFAAWLNHDDTRAHNTQDMWVEESGSHYVRHHLIDFGSSFGSGSVDLQLPNLSFHYWLDMDEVRKNLRGFGFHTPKYRKVEWPNFPEFEAVGRFEAEAFEPQEWKNDYPNPAFVRMTNRDAFWAAKIIMAFTPEELRAIVKTGEYSNPEEEQYFFDTLLERQRKSGQYYINQLNPLDEFRLTTAGLEFTNLAEKYEFAEPGTTYRVTWSLHDNAQDTVQLLEGPISQQDTTLPLPATDGADGRFLLAEIHSLHEQHPEWNKRVGVYLRPSGSAFEVVGIERES